MVVKKWVIQTTLRFNSSLQVLNSNLAGQIGGIIFCLQDPLKDRIGLRQAVGQAMRSPWQKIAIDAT